MGRYYNSASGEVSGKFGFGVQSSDAGTRFGMSECHDHITLYTEDDKEVLEEINYIFESMGVPEKDRRTNFVDEYAGDFQKGIVEWSEKINLWGYAVEDIPEEQYDSERDEGRYHSDKQGYVGRVKSKRNLADYYDLMLGLEIYNDILRNDYCELECEL